MKLFYCKLITIINILFFCFLKVNCQACVFKLPDGTELQEDDTEFGFNLDKIEDTSPVNKSVLKLSVENVKSIQSKSTSSASQLFFLEANLTSELFELTLTDDFLNYEEYEEFLLPIIDTNNNDPKFINAPYTYELSMPFPKGLSLDLLGKISARDIDLTNSKIIFSLDKNDDKSNGFKAEWSSTDSVDKKLHYANLLTTFVINISENLTFNIFATDTGNPPRTTHTTVTITIDKLNSIIKFGSPIYTGNYSTLDLENNHEEELKFNEGDITLSSGIDENIKFTFEVNPAKYQDNFQLKSSNDYSKVQVILKKKLQYIIEESILILTINARKPGTEASTIVITKLSDDSMINLDNSCDNFDGSFIIIILIVLLVIVSIVLVVSIIRNMRYQKDPVVEKTNNANELKPEMTEVARPSSSSNNSQPRRSVTFVDEIKEINIARL
ncbi:cadherin-8-like isoform X2 [Aphidius gifuensis]|uniref:cadherin-8-like isoform X2 n=1 Tax=Aphidius gifuensis TaxID=684658 RepID=UPI001CDC25E6|nr:cadherin-8-like isoform X2 [Aphidius gifuensis]